MIRIKFKDFELELNEKYDSVETVNYEIIDKTYTFLKEIYLAGEVAPNPKVLSSKIIMEPTGEVTLKINEVQKNPVDVAMKQRIPNNYEDNESIINPNNLNNINYRELDIKKPKGIKGFRCPSCHQSLFLKVYMDIDENNHMILARTLNGIYVLQDGVNIEIENTESYDKTVDVNNIDQLMLLTTGDELELDSTNETSCSCPRCHHISDIKSFTLDFIDTASEFEMPCTKCGGEVVAVNKKIEGTEEIITKHVCEQCGYDIQY